MNRYLYLPLLALTLVVHPGVEAADSKELQNQRRAAQKERQARKNDRSKALSDATRTFRDYVRELNLDYRDRVKALATDFELQRVALKADHDARVAGAEAEYQKKLSSLFMRPGSALDEETIEGLRAEGKAFADQMFALRKQGAEELHRARVENEMRKNALWSERDNLAMDQGATLGLTDSYEPILATPIGGDLTDQEERWNEREKKEVAKLMERNRQILREYRNGRALREWELGNLNQDFERTWNEQEELHALDADQIMYNALLMQAAQDGQVNQQKLMARMAEINEQKKLIAIKYRKERDEARIRRREEKKAMADK